MAARADSRESHVREDLGPKAAPRDLRADCSRRGGRGRGQEVLARVGRQRTAPAAAQRPRARHRQQVADHHAGTGEVRPRVPGERFRHAGDPAAARAGVWAADLEGGAGAKAATRQGQGRGRYRGRRGEDGEQEEGDGEEGRREEDRMNGGAPTPTSGSRAKVR